MKATRKNVAELAGVSEQTVSYIMNNSRKFSDEVQKRVQDAIKTLNYHPNMAAKSLVSKRSYSVSVIVHDISNPIFNEIMVGFQEAARESNFFVTLCDAQHDIDKYVHNLISRNIEGVFIYVLAKYEDIQFVEKFIDCDIKVVLSGNVETSNKKILDNITVVDVDHAGGMKKIIDYLAVEGHEDIVYLSGLDIKSHLDNRYKAFVSNYYEIFKKSPTVIENEFPYDTTPEVGFKLTQKLLQSNVKFTTIVTTNDLMAYGSIQALKQNNLRIPEDVSVVGIDDLMFSKYSSPNLTTLGFNKIEYGRKVFEKLLSMINGQSTLDHVMLETEVIERESCKKRYTPS